MSEIGVLALQGSFELHLRALDAAGARGRKVRDAADLLGVRGLIIPGGESTVMSGLGGECGLLDGIRERARDGMPILGTCAGAILLGEGGEFPERLGLAPIRVDRNAYGRQRESFEDVITIKGFRDPFQGIFIRAPKLALPPDYEARGVEVLAWRGDDPVLVRYERILMSTFHPELTDDPRVHELFLGGVG